jgi:hypothetical protein
VGWIVGWKFEGHYSQTIEGNGRPEWIRTIDLFRVNSLNGLRRIDTERERAIRKGSVCAVSSHIRCPSLVPERHSANARATGRDSPVTTQVTTQ